MKHEFKFVMLLVAFLCLGPMAGSAFAQETKRVCVDAQGKDGKPVIDPKTKKPRQNCREVKIHKKHEGTAVPTKK